MNKLSLLGALCGIIRKPLATPAIIRPGEFRGRVRTGDVAFGFRMGAGSVGTVNRTHPANIEPALNDPTNPSTLFGQAVLANGAANSVRSILTSDGGITSIYGVSVRPYPFQQQSATNYGATPFGGEAPAIGAAIDVVRSGYILVQLPNYAAAPSVKGGTVYVWVAASTGNHVLGGFEATSSGSTITLDSKSSFNGPPDANGVVELAFNI